MPAEPQKQYINRVKEAYDIIEQIRALNAGEISLGPGNFEDDYDNETVILAKKALKLLGKKGPLK